MPIVLAIAALLLAMWFRYQYEKACRRDGVPILSRRQLRYVRRKARKQGVSPNEVSYRPQREHPIFLQPEAPASSFLPSVTPTVPMVPRQSTPVEPDGASGGGLKWLLGLLGLAAALLAAVVVGGRNDDGQPAPAQQTSPPAALQAALPASSAPPQQTPLAAQQTRRTVRAVNVRTGPGGNAAVLRTLPANSEFIVVETSGEWAKVAVSGEAPVGWIYLPVTR